MDATRLIEQEIKAVMKYLKGISPKVSVYPEKLKELERLKSKLERSKGLLVTKT